MVHPIFLDAMINAVRDCNLLINSILGSDEDARPPFNAGQIPLAFLASIHIGSYCLLIQSQFIGVPRKINAFRGTYLRISFERVAFFPCASLCITSSV